jgi:hypothetical protein
LNVGAAADGSAAPAEQASTIITTTNPNAAIANAVVRRWRRQ